LCVERPRDLHTGRLIENSSKPVQFSLANLGSARNGAEKFARAHDCTLSDVRGDRVSLKSGIMTSIAAASCVADPSRSYGKDALQLQRFPFPVSHSRSPDEKPAQQPAGVVWCREERVAARCSSGSCGAGRKAMAGSGRRMRKVYRNHMAILAMPF
jgi:hypothetical protein